jgi:YHS domain-containing protein
MKLFQIAMFTMCLAAALSLASGCHNDEKTSSTPATKTGSTNMSAMNDKCMCGHALGSAPVYETYKGKTIAFCCKDCQAKFDKMTAAEKDKYVNSLPTAKVSMGAMNDKCPMSGMAVNKSAPTATYNGKTVGFCCGGCAAKFNALSDADKDKKIAAMTAAK